MIQTNQSKALGKVILIGEHSVVYGQPALLIPLPVFTTISITSCVTEGVRIYIKNSNSARHFALSSLNSPVEELRENREFGLLLHAIAKTCDYLAVDLDYCSIDVYSALPIGGFGSSTSLIVAFVRTMSDKFEIQLSDKELFELVCDIESIFFGYKVPGGDQYAIINERPIELIKNVLNNTVEVNILEKFQILDELIVINSGRAEQTTGELVQYVKTKRWEVAQSVFEKLGKIEKELLKALKSDNREQVYVLIDKTNQLLIELGIVTKDTQQLISEIQKLGGHCKVSGAGAISGKGSGALICLIEEEKREALLRYLNSEGVEVVKS